MEKIVKQGLLYDFYGALLNAHQQEIYEAYVYENLSLSEIALSKGVSRQGIHDIIKRCDKSLDEYENKLHLVERFIKIKEEVANIKKISSQQEIIDIADDILGQL